MISRNDIRRLKSKAEEARRAFSELVDDLEAVDSDPDLSAIHKAELTTLAMESVTGAVCVRNIVTALDGLDV